MKKQVSQKFIRENYKNIIGVGYCELWALLRCKEPKYYTSGVYGWNADIYQVDNETVIVTGYRPFGNIKGYRLGVEVNQEATKVIRVNHDWNKIEEKLDKLIEKFVKEVNQSCI